MTVRLKVFMFNEIKSLYLLQFPVIYTLLVWYVCLSVCIQLTSKTHMTLGKSLKKFDFRKILKIHENKIVNPQKNLLLFHQREKMKDYATIKS